MFKRTGKNDEYHVENTDGSISNSSSVIERTWVSKRFKRYSFGITAVSPSHLLGRRIEIIQVFHLGQGISFKTVMEKRMTSTTAKIQMTVYQIH